jgi:calpain
MVSDAVKEELNFKEQTDGQFFISFSDFTKYFDDIDFVHVNMNAFFSTSNDYGFLTKWIMSEFYGAWVPNQNAGGIQNFSFKGKNFKGYHIFISI